MPFEGYNIAPRDIDRYMSDYINNASDLLLWDRKALCNIGKAKFEGFEDYYMSNDVELRKIKRLQSGINLKVIHKDKMIVTNVVKVDNFMVYFEYNGEISLCRLDNIVSTNDDYILTI